MNPLANLTPEQRAALLKMPEHMATGIIARLMGPNPRGTDLAPVGAGAGIQVDGTGGRMPEMYATPNSNPNPFGFNPNPSGAASGAVDTGPVPPPMAPPQMPPMGRGAPVGPQNEPFDPNLMPGIGEDPRGMFWQEGRNGLMPGDGSSFVPGAEYQTADLGGIKIGSDKNPLGSYADMNNRVAKLAMSYRTLMTELDAYEKTFSETGGVVKPGKEKDALSGHVRNLQLQMKELYNLGVLNGPDLALMEELLVNPTGVGANFLDWTGIADLEERIPANVKQVREMMTRLIEPWATAAEIDLNEIYQPKVDPSKLTDEELLKMLTGG